MNISELAKTAKTTSWLSQGMTEEEIKKIKLLAMIASNIELRRKEMRLNQKEFAKRMGVSQGMVSRWESGEYNFSVSTLQDICQKLDLEFEPVFLDKNYYQEEQYKVVSLTGRNTSKDFTIDKSLLEEMEIA